MISMTCDLKVTSRNEFRPYVLFQCMADSGVMFSFQIPTGAHNSVAKWNNAFKAARELAESHGEKLDQVEIRERFQRLAEGIDP